MGFGALVAELGVQDDKLKSLDWADIPPVQICRIGWSAAGQRENCGLVPKIACESYALGRLFRLSSPVLRRRLSQNPNPHNIVSHDP